MARATWSRKTYELIAWTLHSQLFISEDLYGDDPVISAHRREVIQNIAIMLSVEFQADNPSFDPQRFMDAVKGES